MRGGFVIDASGPRRISGNLDYDGGMSRALSLVATAGVGVALACSSSQGGGGAASAASATSSAAAPIGAASAMIGFGPCGELGCETVESPARALERVLAAKPRVLAIGETHAQRDKARVTSSTRRFTEQLLPLVAPRSSALILELWLPDSRCDKRQVAQVRKQTEVVTKPQAETNQSDFVLLGQRSRALGLEPSVLVPSCDDYRVIAGAGANDVSVMLAMIARLTASDVKRVLARPAAKDRMVITYGGALHNDVAARPGKEAWTYGPELVKATDGAYAELDLIVPEFIGDTESWRSLDWYAHYDAERLGARTVLFHPAPRRWVLIFAKSAANSASAAPSASAPLSSPAAAAPR
jgi:hypothetical protein